MKKKRNNKNNKKRGPMPIKKLIAEVKGLVASVKQLITVQDEAAAKPKPASPSFSFILNDPINSSLIQNITLPSPETGLKVAVRGFVSNPTTNDQNLSAQTYASLQNAKTYIQGIIANSRPKLKKWAAATTLTVVPKAGVDFNAYYDRKNLKFFYDTDTVANNVVYSAQSNDIVTHELGHAVLDALRPDLWSSMATEVWAFHESFGDMLALLSAMTYDATILAALSETSNDLSQSNVISRLAEELGVAVYNMYDGAEYGSLTNALRDASINFTYVKPSLLPSSGRDDVLINESHSFARVFTGAFWDIFVAIYNRNVAAGQARLTAVKNARDTVANYLIKASILAPSNSKFFYSVANAFAAADVAKGSPYQTEILNVFRNRAILPVSLKALVSPINKEVIALGLNDEVVKHNNGHFYKLSHTKCVKLSSCCKQSDLSALSDIHDMMDIEITIPADVYYEFDKNGNAVAEIKNNEQESIKDAVRAVRILKNKNMIGSDKAWEVKSNKLERNKICRCFCKH